jgi:hypothetical protein
MTTDNETLTPEQAVKRLPTIRELSQLVRDLKPTILDDYRSTDADPDDTAPSMDLTIGWTPETGAWDYQTGDNSYTGGAYGHPYWATTVIDRRCNSRGVARDLRDQLCNQLLW